MSDIAIIIGEARFTARFEPAAAMTVARIREALPIEDRLIHVRWSGEACWIPMGGRNFELGYENATSYPAPGQAILYPGGTPGAASETEILIAYGPTRFASKAGQLAGNHFLTITEDLERLAETCRAVLWQGARPIRLAAA